MLLHSQNCLYKCFLRKMAIDLFWTLPKNFDFSQIREPISMKKEWPKSFVFLGSICLEQSKEASCFYCYRIVTGWKIQDCCWLSHLGIRNHNCRQLRTWNLSSSSQVIPLHLKKTIREKNEESYLCVGIIVFKKDRKIILKLTHPYNQILISLQLLASILPSRYWLTPVHL